MRRRRPSTVTTMRRVPLVAAPLGRPRRPRNGLLLQLLVTKRRRKRTRTGVWGS
jgi:hypothetical protein